MRDFAPEGSLLREALLCVPMIIAAVVMVIIVQLTGVHSSVIEGYFPYADAMFNGIMPYSQKVYVYDDWNVWEYPPLTYLFLFIPRLFSADPTGYQIAYVAMILVILGIGLHSVGKIAEHLDYNRTQAQILFILLIILMVEFVFDRFDVIPMVTCILAVQFFLERRYPFAAAMIALGMAVKVYPIFLLPVLALWLVRRGDGSQMFRCGVAFACTCLLAVPFILMGDLSQMVAYHSYRPLEIESMAAVLLQVVSLIVPDMGMHVVYSYGSDNLVGGVADAIAGIPSVVAFISIVVVLLYCHYESKHGKNITKAFAAMFLVVSSYICFGSVFSSQYVLWILPFVLLFSLSCNSEAGKWALILFIIVELFTQLNIILNFGMRPDLGNLSAIGIITLAIRNSVLLFMFVEGLLHFRRENVSLDAYKTCQQ